MKELSNRFLAAKDAQRAAGDITTRSYEDYFRTCKRLLIEFGSNRLVDDLAADDFERLRAGLAKQYGVHRLGNEVQRTRVVFKGLVDYSNFRIYDPSYPQCRKVDSMSSRVIRSRTFLAVFAI